MQQCLHIGRRLDCQICHLYQFLWHLILRPSRGHITVILCVFVKMTLTLSYGAPIAALGGADASSSSSWGFLDKICNATLAIPNCSIGA